MYRVCGFVFLFFIFLFNSSLSSAQNCGISMCSIDAYRVSVSCDQTTNIIFPYSIKSVDRGSAWILAQKAKGVENVLQLKAGRRDFTETNVTVICGDGQLYSFLLSYAPFPSFLNLRMERQISDADSSVVQFAGGYNEESISCVAEGLLKHKPFMRFHRTDQRMNLHLKGIYLVEDLLWFGMRLKNYSMIDFAADGVRVFVRDKKRAKRTAVQEKEVVPVFGGQGVLVKGSGLQELVFGFVPFTLLKSQRLFVRVLEHNGGRQITLRIKPRMLLRAKPVK